jgi:hypothetical protein
MRECCVGCVLAPFYKFPLLLFGDEVTALEFEVGVAIFNNQMSSEIIKIN